MLLRFDREIQFYLGYLEFMARLRQGGSGSSSLTSPAMAVERSESSTANRSRRATACGAQGHTSTMSDECPMTEDCPGYDRDSRTCLLRPDDCEFAPADGEAAPLVETREALAPDASA